MIHASRHSDEPAEPARATPRKRYAPARVPAWLGNPTARTIHERIVRGLREHERQSQLYRSGA